MNSIRKCIWLTGVLFLTVLSFLVLPAGAEMLDLPFSGAYVIDDVESGELNSYLTEPLDHFSGHWEFLGDTGNPDKRTVDGLGMLFTEGKSSDAGYMEFQYLESTDLSGAVSLAFGLNIVDRTVPGVQEPGTIPEGIYQVSVTVLCGGMEYVSNVYLEGNRWYIVYSDLPDAARKQDVESIRIRISYSEGTRAGRVRITSPCASDKDCVFVQTFSAEKAEAVLGTVRTQSTRIYLSPDTGGAVVMTAEVNMPRHTSEVTGWYMAVDVEGAAAGGEMAAGVMYRIGEYVYPQWLDTAAVEVLEGKHTYYFPIPLPESYEDPENTSAAGAYATEYLPDPESCRLSFQNVTGSGSSLFRVTGIKWIPVVEPVWKEGALGSMTEGTLRDGEIQWNGKLNRQTVIDYIDADIALMAVPVWDRYNLKNARELARVGVSNSFSFTMDAESAAMYAAGWMFYCAVRTEKTVQDPMAADVHYLPVSQPRMLAGASPAPCVLSMFGFHEANPVGVYESNVSHVTVDVQLDQLILPGGTGIVCAYGGRSCTLSQAYLSQLDNDIRFYSDAGLEVSLRLLSAEPYLWSEKQAENYLPLAEREEELYSYAAALSYLCSRYPSVASITLGMGINCEKYTGLSLVSPETVMKKVAVLAALTYETARLEIPDIYVVIPLADGHTYSSEDALPDHGIVLDPEWTLILLADAMDSLGKIPWVVSWRFESDRDLTEAAALPDRWEHILKQMNLPVFEDFLYRWEPEVCLQNEPVPYSFAGRYEKVCMALAENNPRAVILSFARIADYVSQSMFAAVTELPDPSGDHMEGRQVQKFRGILTEGGAVTEPYSASMAIWDFTSSYTTDGFIAGGGIEEVFTTSSKRLDQFTNRSGSRVLRSVLPVSLYENSTVGTAGGILLRNFDGVVDLSGVDTLQFTFSLTENGNSAAKPTVVFLMGADDWRAEYHAEGVVSDTVMTVSCDLREYANAARTEYIGVMLYGETDLIFDLVSVYACSLEGTEAALQNAFVPAEPVNSDSPYATEIFYILALLAVMSVSVGILLFRRDREDEDEEDGIWK